MYLTRFALARRSRQGRAGHTIDFWTFIADLPFLRSLEHEKMPPDRVAGGHAEEVASAR